MAKSQPLELTLRIEVMVAAQIVDLGPNVLWTGSVYSMVAHVEACLGDKEMQKTIPQYQSRQDDGQRKTYIHVEVVRRIKARLCYDLIFGKGYL